MSKHLFVVLSDIHIKAENKKDIQYKMDVFIKTLNARKKMGEFNKIIIIASGDIAFSGKKEEYEYLENYFEELATNYDLVMCPGNHDHDFSSYPSLNTRKQLLKMDIEQQDPESINIITKGMQPFFDFKKRLQTFTPKNVTPLSESYDLCTSSTGITVATLNTAWCSMLHERGGDIKFPVKYLPKVEKGKNNILFFHHPLGWFEPDNQKVVRNSIRENYSIIITGHEHLNDTFKIVGESNSCLMIEAMPFDDPSVKENGFLSFEIEDSTVNITSYVWKDNAFESRGTYNKNDILKAHSVSNSNVTVNYDYYTSLLDIGVNYIHPDKDTIDLNDVFVYPNLKILSEENKFDMKKVASNSIINSDRSRMLLIGDEYCGKSTLLRKLFIDAILNNQIPLLIEGSSIRNGNIEYDKIISRHVSKEYDKLTGVDFINLPGEKILLLDGFEYIKGDKKSITSFLSKSVNVFDKIIITVSDTFDFSGSELLGDGYFEDGFHKFEILKLGHRLRYELVNKWNQLKEECNLDNGALLYKNNHAVKTITKVIGRNYVPSTPFFLLTLLQSMESGNALEVSANTYGYYYEYLITQSLGNASVKKEELDEFFNYVKILANHFFTKNLKDESKNALWDFNRDFCNDYGVKIDFESRFKLLVNAKILEKKDGDYYKFKYPYVYYFFIAKHLSDTIRSQETIDIIDKLVSTLGRRKSMSILMFLTHHSRDESILDKVVLQAQSLFSRSHPSRLDVDTQFVNNIVQKMPMTPITFEKQNLLEFRRKIETQKDDIEEGHDQDYDSMLNREENDEEEQSSNTALEVTQEQKDVDEANNYLKDMNLTFKSLEILGQLSRNYYGSLKVSQKKKLLEEAIKAPLRSLDYFFSLIEQNADSSIDMIEKKILDKIQSKVESNTENEMREVAKKMLFEMIFGLCFFFITKISTSIGSTNLQQVIDDVCDEMDSNAGKLIKLATMLELGNIVSLDQLKRSLNDFEKNHLADRLTKSIILNYLYMFERSDQDAQQICSLAGINFGNVSKQIAFERLK
ncbi:metallophosphoesterase [Cronobacter sakazakii]|uniref:metallophosphoesterase family protein n=2 Tax=Cronobacter sakazakii TaxID=28141 RepID=UPI000948F8C1|nr:metallophosphoesterase family protein [Cronobacter sakazakii]EKA1095124.1 metallophosphatase family protein [Cronobacter sakazakii]EKK7697094.1 metallophosphatase family protein [Cronobacter sakazakii]ELY3816470.1 metallophosphatase family protein [Cronobacter sakazakii]ELY3832323.1 metallophosphatase family protein [Cronobacter sakazakii]ELY4202849.1 metallophosphatase family protein [Cronobacter sakazakii]